MKSADSFDAVNRKVPAPTRRLRFREYGKGDLGFVADLFGDSQARRFYPTMDTDEAHRRWINWNLANYREHGFGLWVIEQLEGDVAMGDCGLTLQEVRREKQLEIGYHLKETYRGRGYAAEAAAACLAYAFDELGAESVCSIVDPANQPSIAVAARLHDSRTSLTNARGDRMILFTTTRARHHA